MQKKLLQNSIFKFLSSLKLTVTCLFLLFVLTWWGTVFQVNHGLYLAQKQIFHGFMFLAFGFLPFPGAQLVLWVFFINLVCVALTRFIHYRFNKIGILIIHFGILTYFVGAFVTFTITKETFLQLLEGEGSNVSAFYHDWELSIWKEDGSSKKVTALNVEFFQPRKKYPLDERFSLEVESYYPNAQVFNQALTRVANFK